MAEAAPCGAVVLAKEEKAWWLKPVYLGAYLSAVYIWKWYRSGPCAPLHAELGIFRTLWHDGFRRIFQPSDDDGTSALSLWDRVRRVGELKAILALERNRQIDLAKGNGIPGSEGWGETAGIGHMRHLPGLVFRGEDTQLTAAALSKLASLDKQEALRLRLEAESTPILKDLVLIGGGHSHVNLLRMFGMEPLPGVRITMITRDVETPYSGMIPGHVAGLYTRRECHLDLNILARFANVRLIHGSAVGLDLANKRVLMEGNRPPIGYDVLSINTGSAPQVRGQPSGSEVTAVKPIDGFGLRWDNLLRQMTTWKGERKLVVVGGGAGGFELAVSMHARLRKELAKLQSDVKLAVALVTRGELMPQHTPGARSLAKKAMRDRGIALHTGCEVVSAETGTLRCKGGLTLPYDDCIWCTEGAAPTWVQKCGLETDSRGFLLVDQQMRCTITDVTVDGGQIFSGGDVATVRGHDRPKAGVFAVMAGLTLWYNIRATLRGEKLVTYHPQSSFLGLLGLGDGDAIASRGTLATQGRWLWELKDWIDRKWMWNYSGGLPEMPEPAVNAAVAAAAGSDGLALLQKAFMRCGGCGAKVGATTLSQAMSRVQMPKQPAPHAGAEVVVGAGDDAAVVDLSLEGSKNKISSVQTIDFFRSFIGDTYLFGRIATMHALSDCEAMGAVPQTALALAQLPYAKEEKTEEELVQLMAGAASALEEAGCALVGGHTCEAKELGFGLAVVGRLPDSRSKALVKGALRKDDVLILTKPLGTGTLFAADMRAKACGPWIAAALRAMATSNAKAAAIAREHGAAACTDVTGFGLVGHLLEMCRAAGMRARVRLDRVPLYDGALQCIGMGITSSLQPANTRLRRAVSNHEAVCKRPAYPLLFDPQTSGGLLVAVPRAKADQCVEQLRASGAAPQAAIIGEVVDGPPVDAALGDFIEVDA
eukprot:TRINITY_DN74860_c0_g1_i1.p1 TRINITY_DN74860_c0_g1~~TRINITY_DN74860_c0_g1_i1.p1  ORF type:complete len:936 (+),score=227.58 TRINITY_DN74860_c0_g1_i1:109-2916(+)